MHSDVNRSASTSTRSLIHNDDCAVQATKHMTEYMKLGIAVEYRPKHVLLPKCMFYKFKRNMISCSV